MMKWAILAFLVGTVSAAQAQPPDEKRLRAIWASANDRIVRQTDAWFKDGDYPRVVQLLRMHYTLEPSDLEIGTNLGWMLENIERWDEALAVYVQIRKENPTVPDAAFPEANFYFMKKVYAKVPPLLEPGVSTGRVHGNSYRILAHSYERMNMLSDSKRVWEAYLATEPDDKLVAQNNLNRVLKKLSGKARSKK